MAKSEPPKGNIGEWSELYALGYLLVHGGAYAADENQNAIPEMFHKVLQVYLAQRGNLAEINYVIDSDDIAILISGEHVGRVERSALETTVNAFLLDITDGNHSRTFPLITGKQLLELLRKETISAGSSEYENDLELILEDMATGSPSPRVGFNIKSQLGGRSTLLNASGATNLIYEVIANDETQDAPLPQFQHGKHQQNLAKLYDAGFHLEFSRVSSNTFQNNLTLLDMKFPEILGKLLLHSYRTGQNKLEDAVVSVYPSDDAASRQPVFKIKEFLGAVAMGLRPSIEWDGDTTRFSGILVVKSNGEIIFYYLYNRKKFEEHLFKNVAFERASTSRHQYGFIFEENGKRFMALNLQIRFTT